MKKHQHYINVWGEVLPTPHGSTTAVVTLIIWKNGSLRKNRELTL